MTSRIQEKIIKFLVENIITIFGIPQKLSMDNRPNFKGKDMKEFCKIFHITQKIFYVYYPQGNGEAKSSNKIIKSILVKIWNGYKKDWHE